MCRVIAFLSSARWRIFREKEITFLSSAERTASVALDLSASSQLQRPLLPTNHRQKQRSHLKSYKKSNHLPVSCQARQQQAVSRSLQRFCKYCSVPHSNIYTSTGIFNPRRITYCQIVPLFLCFHTRTLINLKTSGKMLLKEQAFL